MAPLITTYRHDYIDPKEMALNVLKTQSSDPADSRTQKKDCTCEPEIQPLDKLNADAGATAEGRGQSEWTGIAPMGILIKPRVIPGATDDDDADNANDTTNPCFVDKPNKYLQSLPNAYPNLYDDLKRMNKDDLQKIINTDRMMSTYQVDYGGMSEYPGGTYDLDEENDAKDSMIRTFRTELSDPCGEDAIFKDHAARVKRCGYRPPMRAKVCCKHCPVTRGHWKAEEKEMPVSEYVAKTGKTGALILSHNLNDHFKCKPNNCKHEVMFNLLAKC